MGLPPAVTGNAEVQADLEGTGDTPHALAASLNGWVGVAVKEGQIDTRVVNRMLERVKPIQVRGGDVTELRCFAVRADVKAGIATVQPVALNTPALILEGEGSLDLGQETLLLRLRPRAKIGGTGISLPVRVSGPWRKPVTAVDISPSGGGGLVGLVLGGKDILGAAGGGDPCPGGLAHAREVPPRYDTNGR